MFNPYTLFVAFRMLLFISRCNCLDDRSFLRLKNSEITLEVECTKEEKHWDGKLSKTITLHDFKSSLLSIFLPANELVESSKYFIIFYCDSFALSVFFKCFISGGEVAVSCYSGTLFFQTHLCVCDGMRG